jgi:hypothetical protein
VVVGGIYFFHFRFKSYDEKRTESNLLCLLRLCLLCLLCLIFFFFERKRGKLRSFQVSFQLTQKEVGVVETNSFEPSRRYSFRRVPSNVALLQNAILRMRRNVSIRGFEWRSDAHDSLVRAIRIRIFIASFTRPRLAHIFRPFLLSGRV